MGRYTLVPIPEAPPSPSAMVPRQQSVLLLGAGLSLLRCFAGARIPLFLADSDPQSLTLYSRYLRRRWMIAPPTRDPQQAVRDLVAIGKTFADRPMLAFDNENLLLLVSRHREELSTYYRFLLPSQQLVEDVTSKLRFANLAQELNLPVPRNLVPTKDTTIDEIVGQIGLPCVLKPSSHLGRYAMQVKHENGHAYKVLRVDTVEQLRIEYQQMVTCCDSFVVQQYIPGDDGSLYSLHVYFGHDGKPLGLFTGRKIRTCPKDSGYSAYIELVHEPELVKLGLELLQRMQHRGPAKLDFKRDPATGRYYLLECNARFTLWNYLGAACGMNLPLLAMADLYGQSVHTPATYHTHAKWFSFGNDFRAFYRDYRPAGDWTWGRWLWSLCSRKIYDVFAWRDPLPGIICANRYLAANWRKVKRLLGRRPPNTIPATS